MNNPRQPTFHFLAFLLMCSTLNCSAEASVKYALRTFTLVCIPTYSILADSSELTTLSRGLLERKVYNKLCNTLTYLANARQIPEPTPEWIQILTKCEVAGEIHLQDHPQLPKLLRSWIEGFKIPDHGTAEYEKAQFSICTACQALDRLEYCQTNPSSYKDAWSFSIEGLAWRYWSTDFDWEYSSEGIDWGCKEFSMFELWLSPKKILRPRGPLDDEYDYSDAEMDELDETRSVTSEDGSSYSELGFL